eukprot:14947305-Alexandrium_andersonii.AAC.1
MRAGVQRSHILVPITWLSLAPLRETPLRPILSRFGVDADDVWPTAEHWGLLGIRIPERLVRRLGA